MYATYNHAPLKVKLLVNSIYLLAGVGMSTIALAIVDVMA